MHVINGLDAGGAEAQLAQLMIHAPCFAEGALLVSLTAGGVWAERLRAVGLPPVELGMARGGPSLAGLSALARLVRTLRPAIVQGWMYHANLAATFAVALSGRRRATRLLWGLRASDLDLAAYGPSTRWAVRLSAWASRCPAAIVANSEAARAAHERLGFRPRRIVVVPNGIDTGRFRPDAAARRSLRAELGLDPTKPVIVHVARVDPMKDHATFLAALDRVAPTTTLLVGAGTKALPDRAGLLRLGVRHDIERVLASADVFISSSAFGEGFSNAIGEAMACALPVVATDVGDARLVVGDAGVIVPPRDAAALAHAIQGMLDRGPEARAALGRAARERIETNFTIAKAAERFAALYEERA
jgi:glycosyltransferase involved in cell wall biosynthesis